MTIMMTITMTNTRGGNEPRTPSRDCDRDHEHDYELRLRITITNYDHDTSVLKDLE